MSHDRKVNNKPADFSRVDLSSSKLDFGVYIGIVKNNFDKDRKGRLEVWIPDLGGDENNEFNWRPVNYASPYMGSTYLEANRSKDTTFNTVNHTYGMWMIPPDIGAQVLVTFINGRPDKGYWFACISPHASHNMMPALASSSKWNENQVFTELPADIQQKTKPGQAYPSLEFNENNPALRQPGFQNRNERPLHREQFLRLVDQGLENDTVRGTTSSSSQRESPSYVFGISTPGRPDPDIKDNNELLQKINENTAKAADFLVTRRKGGHTFVMDDGDLQGNDQQIKLRTAAGHQIVMHDSGNTMYISNSNGSVWIELSNSGQLHIFSSDGVNVRTQGDLNLHSDRDVNINAGGSFNLKAANNIKLESQTTTMASIASTTVYAANIELLANQNLRGQAASGIEWNSGSPITVPSEIPVKELTDTKLDPNSQTWVSVEKSLTSIVGIAPTHEPYSRKSGSTVTPSRPPASSTPVSSSASGGTGDNTNVNESDPNTPTLSSIECSVAVLSSGAGGAVLDGSGNPVGTGSANLDSGPSMASGKPIKSKLDKSKLSQQPVPISGIGPLSVSEVRAVMAQLGWKESSWNYSAVNTFGFSGKYQFGAAALVDRGYIHKDYYDRYKNSALTIDNAWTGKNGINSQANWLANTTIQEQVMYEQLNANYQQLVRNNGIKEGDDKCTIGGMLCVAHLLGPNRGTSRAPGALGWRQTGNGNDAYGTSGTDYYNMGRYAIDVLAIGA